MNIPRLSWHTSSKIEALRILGTLKGIASNFFTKYDFLILPYVYRDAVLLPQLDYFYLPQIISDYHFNYIDKNKKYSLEALNEKERKIVETIIKQLKTVPELKLSQKAKKIIRYCQKDWPLIAKTISQFFPFWSQVGIIDVFLVNYGTVSSFDYIANKNQKDKIIIWLRQTQPSLQIIKSHFIHALISALVLNKTKISDQSDLWTAREYAIDFLLAHTKLATLAAPVFTIRELKRKNLPSKIIHDSQIFKKKITKHQQPIPVKLDKSKKEIKINKNSVKLNYLEWHLFETLYSERGNFIKTGELLNHVYGEENDNCSLWSLAKVVERLRKKIALTGISQQIIISSKGMGYMLRN